MSVPLSLISRKNPKTFAMGNRVCLLGDSITVNAYSFSVIAAYLANMVLVKNAGISGNMLSQMNSRFESDLGSEDYDVLILNGGTNDVANGVSVDASIDALNGICEKASANGITTIVVPPATRSDGFRGALLELRETIKTYCYRENIICCDAFLTSISPDSGDWLNSHSGDGVHPAMISRQKASAILRDCLIDVCTLNKVLRPCINYKANGIFSNPLMMLDSNGDGYADGYYYGSIGQPSLVVDPDFIGKAQHFSATGIGNSFVTHRITTALGLIAGHRYLATMRYKITGYDGSYSFYSYIKGTTTNYAKSLHDSFVGNFLGNCSIEYVAQNGDSELLWVTGITKISAAANCEISIGEMQFYDLGEN
jgi:lysophospholipase L1-like esterase